MFKNKASGTLVLAVIISVVFGASALAQHTLTADDINRVGHGRYTAAPGFKVHSDFKFTQPDYKFPERLPEGFGKKTASELGVAGHKFLNDYPSIGAVEVIMAASTFLVYDTVSQEILYVLGCLREGRPGMNRVHDITPPPPKLPVLPTVTRTEPPPPTQPNKPPTFDLVIRKEARVPNDHGWHYLSDGEFEHFAFNVVNDDEEKGFETDENGEIRITLPAGETSVEEALTDEQRQAWIALSPKRIVEGKAGETYVLWFKNEQHWPETPTASAPPPVHQIPKEGFCKTKTHNPIIWIGKQVWCHPVRTALIVAGGICVGTAIAHADWGCGIFFKKALEQKPEISVVHLNPYGANGEIIGKVATAAKSGNNWGQTAAITGGGTVTTFVAGKIIAHHKKMRVTP